MVVDISEAKAQLSHLVDLVYHREKVVVTKNQHPLVVRSPIDQNPNALWDFLKEK